MAFSTGSMRMLSTDNLGRDWNRMKSDKWSFYLRSEGEESRTTLNMVKAATAAHKAKVPGGSAALELQKISRNKVQIAWPRPVCADSCSKVLKHALGDKWRDFVTDPAVVQGASQAAATAREEEPSFRPRPT